MDLSSALPDPRLVASTFVLIFVAELPDKTAVATLLLGAGRRPFAAFIGVAAAFLVQTIVAVVFGAFLALLPGHVVRWISGVLFIVFAVMMLRRDDCTEACAGAGETTPLDFAKSAMKAFLVIFMAEWGDLTQLATAALAAKHRDAVASVFLGSLAALWTVTALAIWLGHHLQRRIRPVLLQRVAAGAFAMIGVLFLCGFGLGK